MFSLSYVSASLDLCVSCHCSPPLCVLCCLSPCLSILLHTELSAYPPLSSYVRAYARSPRLSSALCLALFASTRAPCFRDLAGLYVSRFLPLRLLFSVARMVCFSAPLALVVSRSLRVASLFSATRAFNFCASYVLFFRLSRSLCTVLFVSPA